MIGRSWLGAGSMCLLLLCVTSAAVARGPMPPTHSMALDAVADTVAEDLLRGATFPPGRPVALVAPAPGDTLGLLSQSLMEKLKARGVSVRLTAASASALPGTVGQTPVTGTVPPDSTGISAARAADPVERPLRLQVEVEGSSISYVRRLGSFPFGTKGYERLAGMRASATLVDPVNGEVVWTRSAAKSAADVVAKGDVAYAASGSGLLNPPVPRGGGTRWLEPMIVLGVVAGLVVLFYSNRN